MTVQPKLLNLSAYINQHLENELSLTSLAARMNLSPFHFHRKFKAYFGESLHQHIKRLRLERAATELLHHIKSVRAIALDSGYKTVSAFSHAFSSFAGISPTRYRTDMLAGPVARARDRLEEKLSKLLRDALEPTWIGELEDQAIAFVRADGSGRGEQPSMRDAIETLAASIGVPSRAIADAPTAEGSAGVDAASNGVFEGIARAPEFVAATTDLYGIAEDSRFRIDVGLDTAYVSPERRKSFGEETLPGGRYAMFDVQCQAAQMLDVGYAAYLYWLPQSSERPRSSPHFVRFHTSKTDDRDADAGRDYRLYIPLES